MDGITNSMDMSLSKLQEFGDGQGSLVCCSPWGCKESDTTELTDFLNSVLISQNNSLTYSAPRGCPSWSFHPQQCCISPLSNFSACSEFHLHFFCRQNFSLPWLGGQLHCVESFPHCPVTVLLCISPLNVREYMLTPRTSCHHK